MQTEEYKSLKILKTKMKEWFEYEQDGELPSYAVYALLNIIKKNPELSEDTTFSQNIREYIIQQNLKVFQEDSLQAAKVQSIFDVNRTNSLYKYENNTKNNTEFKFVEKCSNTHQVLEPWQVLLDLGPASSLYEYELLVDVLRDFSKTSLRGLAHTLIVISNHHSSMDNQKNLETITMKCNMKGDMTYMNEDPKSNPVGLKQWNLDCLAKALREIYAGAAWVELVKFLDVDLNAREDFYFQSREAFDIFMNIWGQLKPQNKAFPVEILIANTWKNKKAQVICLDHAINFSYDNNDILFEKAKRRQDVLSTLQSIKSSTANYLRIWKCIDLVQTLVILSESPHYHQVRQMFDAAIKFIPEYLLLTLIKTKPKSGRFLLEDLYSHLLPTFLHGHVNSIPVLTEVWNADKTIMINAMSELYRRNPKTMNLSRILDISQSIKNSLLEIITCTKDYNFSLQLGMLGAKRDFLHFENWIVMLINQEGDPFVRCLFQYINEFLIVPAEEVKEDKKKVEAILERSQLSEEKLSMIYENLHQICEGNPELLEFETRKMYSESFSKVVVLFPNIHTEQSNNEEIEEKANEYFQQLYKGEKQVEDLVKIMKDFRSSQNQTEREIYACMVQNLFDEWKFFPKYPKKELWMTARLFGKIIGEKKIIDGVITDIGLKCIVEGLKREGKMFDFAITALEECKFSIEHETGLKNILACLQLKEKKPELYEYINNRYQDLHGRGTEQKLPKPERETPPPTTNFPEQVVLRPEPIIPAEMAQPPIISTTPDPRLTEGAFHPSLGRINKQKPMVQPQHPQMNTPTQPSKYFNNQQQMPTWQHTPQQMTSNRMIYPPGQGEQQRSARPMDNFSLGPAATDPITGMAPRALNLQSKDFKPKTQQVQEYLKKDDMNLLPQDFIDNLMTMLNMTGTDQIRKNSEKLEEEIDNDFIPSIAHYIVVRRVIESDEKRIDFLASFFHWMKKKKVVDALITECIEVILRIIISESANPNKNEVTRAASTPIKNVACFLGYLTLVHNKPLLSKDLDLKQLLLEAHEKKCIGITILVVCKILRTGEKSRIFTPLNPWMLGLYKIVNEYMHNYLLQNHEYDKNIEKEINLMLRNRKADMSYYDRVDSRLLRDFDQKNYNNIELTFLLSKINNDPLIILPEIPITINEQEEEKDEEYKDGLGEINFETSESDIEAVNVTLVIEKFPQLNQQWLKVLASDGINQAIKEIIEAVIRRVVPIASITTRVLVLKDFALESDSDKLKNASVYTAKSLAGMLAQITCKDILKYQLARSLKELLGKVNDPALASFNEENKKELIELIIKENYDIGCNKIINEVQKEALNNISKDDSVLDAINKRLQHQIDGSDFRDLSNMANFNRLPSILKPSEQGLTDAEFQVYNDFENIPNAELEQQIENDIMRMTEDDDTLSRPAEESKGSQGNQEQNILAERFVGLCIHF